MGPVSAILIGVLALVLGAIASFLITRWIDRSTGQNAQEKARALEEQARRDADRLIKEAEVRAKEETLHRRDELQREIDRGRQEIREHERRLLKREDTIDQKADLVNKKERTIEVTQRKLAEQMEQLEARSRELDHQIQRQGEMLQQISGMTRDDARDLLLNRLEDELRHEAGGIILRHEQHLRETCEAKAREILATAIQRYAAEHTAETTVSTVDIPSDDMKGRIIGREGRNIRAFEKATGVDVIVDDTPGLVIVSGFDNIRRETAKLALQKLIQDGRIHPSRIEEVVAEMKEEMEQHIRKLGRQAAQDADVPGLHEKLIDLLGRLRFRTSYSQNVLQHSIEVAYLCGLMADELGLDGALARRCGLLHDIGKAADHEMEGGHPQIGADLCKRYGERPEVVHAALGHHDDLRPEYPYTVLVGAADAISASRPGARRETLEKYVKRLEELEAVACGFPGVEQAYAIQAGREVRVIADARRLSDQEAAKICRDIARAIEEQLTYPGEVKVTVLRETRSVEYAR